MNAVNLITNSWATITREHQDPALVLASACQLLIITLIGWLTLIVIAAVVSAIPGQVGRSAGRCARAITPALLRRAAAATIGLITAVGPAQAWAADSADLPAPGQPVVQELAAQPSAASGTHHAKPTQPAAPPTVIVKPGDTLWGLARSGLGPTATDPQIANTWPAWWHDNREVIGPDPNVLRPGQTLRVPDQSR